MHSSQSVRDLAEGLFAQWLTAHEEGRAEPFDDFVARHGAHERLLRELHADWSDFAQVLRQVAPRGELEQWSVSFEDLDGDEGHWPSASDAELLERLGVRRPDGERYRFRSVIGRGGGGVVLAVWDGVLGREVAMKLALGAESVSGHATPPTRRQRARFVNEARVTSLLDHPGIVPVHELGSDADGRLYFTMKLVRGADLRALFSRFAQGDPGWRLPRVLDVFLRVCDALAYAHDYGVVHRDLKPANVMVGDYGEVYVMDWGLARWIDSGRSSSARRASAAAPTDTPSATGHGSIVGTPFYMSPEQAAGLTQTLGPAWDIYALGAMLYELLAGAPPHSSSSPDDTASDVLRAVVQGPPRPVRELAPRAAPELIAICERAMARDPLERYASMGELARDLRAHLGGRVVAAHDESAWAQASKWVRRNRALSSSLAAALAILVAGFVLTTLEARRANAAERDAERQAEATRVNAEQAETVVALMQETLTGLSPVAGGTPQERVRGALLYAAERIDDGVLASAPEHEARLWSSLAALAIAMDQRDLALDAASRAASGLAATLGETHPDVAAARSLHGRALSDMGRYQEALAELETAVASYRRARGEHRTELARTLVNLGVVRGKLAHFSEALAAHSEALELRRSLHGAEHLSVAASLADIGMARLNLGEVMVAVEHLERALVMVESMRLGDTLQFAQWRHNLGVALTKLERHDQALEHFSAALAMRRRLHEGDHTDIAESLRDAGLAKLMLGRRDEARADIDDALAHFRRVLGDAPDGDVAECLGPLGGLHSLAGEHAKALEYFEQGAQVSRALLEPNHPKLAQFEVNAGYSCMNLGRLAEAEELLRAALDKLRRAHEGDHQTIGNALVNLGGCLEAQGRVEEALAAHREAREQYERLWPGDHPDISNALSNESLCLQNLGRVDEALERAERALALRCSHFGERDVLVARSFLAIGSIRFLREEDDEALEHYLRAIDTFERSLPFDAQDCATAHRGAAVVFKFRKRHGDALAHLERALELREQLFGPRHVDVLTVVLDMASVLHASGDLDAALATILRACELADELLPAGHAQREGAARGRTLIFEALEAHRK